MAQMTSLYAVVLILLASYQCNAWLFEDSSSSSRSSSRGSSSTRSHDIGSVSGLGSLFNQRVVDSDGVRRPLESVGRMLGSLSQSGTSLTSQDRSRGFADKVGGYDGRGRETVMTPAKHISDRWETIRGSSRGVHGSRVGDFARTGGRDFSLLRDNCRGARCRMFGLP